LVVFILKSKGSRAQKKKPEDAHVRKKGREGKGGRDKRSR